MKGQRFTLQVNPAIAELLHEDEKRLIGSLEKRLGKRIVIYPNRKLHMEEFDIFETVE